MPVTKDQILEVLRTCNDPELGINIVDLGLVYDIHQTNKKIEVVMTLTTPGCPLLPYFQQEVTDKVRQVSGVLDVTIDLTFEPPWNPDKMTELAKKQLAMMR